MSTHSSVLAWRIPVTGEPGGLPSMGSHRVGHDWSDLAAVAAAHMPQIPKLCITFYCLVTIKLSGLTSNILVSVDQEFGNSLAWCFWLRVAHEVTVKVLAGAAVIWSNYWVWMISLEDGSLTWLMIGDLVIIGCWPRDPTPLPCYKGHFIGLLKCLHSRVTVFPRANDHRKRARRKPQRDFSYRLM